MVTPPLSTRAAENVVRGQRLPWLTLAVAALALIVHFSPRAAALLIGERERVLAGEVWRLWTAHAVHFSVSHLAWNLLVTFAAGVWMERIASAPTRLFYGLGAPLITAAAFTSPGLHAYGGLSGLATGLVVLLAVTLIRQTAQRGWHAWALLGLVVAKIAWELTSAAPLFAEFRGAGIRPVPVAHLAGAILGATLAIGPRRA